MAQLIKLKTETLYSETVGIGSLKLYNSKSATAVKSTFFNVTIQGLQLKIFSCWPYLTNVLKFYQNITKQECIWSKTHLPPRDRYPNKFSEIVANC